MTKSKTNTKPRKPEKPKWKYPQDGTDIFWVTVDEIATILGITKRDAGKLPFNWERRTGGYREIPSSPANPVCKRAHVCKVASWYRANNPTAEMKVLIPRS